MTTQLHNTGEEYIVDQLDGTVYDIALYHDGEVSGDTVDGDDLAEDSTLADVNTEPSDGNYARQQATLNTAKQSGDWNLDNGSVISFDMNGTTGTVDAYIVIANFDSDDAGGTGDHIVNTGNLSQEYDLKNLTTLEIEAGGVGISLT